MTLMKYEEISKVREMSAKSAICRRKMTKPLEWLHIRRSYMLTPITTKFPVNPHIIHHGSGRLNNPDRKHLDAWFPGIVDHVDPGQSHDGVTIGDLTPEHINRYHLGFSFFVFDSLPEPHRSQAMHSLLHSMVLERSTLFIAVSTIVSLTKQAERDGWFKVADGWADDYGIFHAPLDLPTLVLANSFSLKTRIKIKKYNDYSDRFHLYMVSIDENGGSDA